jgi:hypothetical protein
LYTAPRQHPSGLGYEIYATELAALLLGKERPAYQVLRVLRDLLPESDDAAFPHESLASAQDVKLSIAGTSVGEFRRPRRGEPRSGTLVEEVDFHAERIASLAAYATADARLFIPLSFPLRGEEEVTVEWTSRGETIRTPVGHITRARGVLGQLTIDWASLEAQTGGPYSFRPPAPGELGLLEMHSHGRVENVRVLIGGEAVLVGEPRDRRARLVPRRLRELLLGRPWVRTVFRPVAAEYIYFRGGEGQYIDVGDLESERGSIDLTFRDSRGLSHALPLLTYERVTIDGAPFTQPLRDPVGRAGPSRGKSRADEPDR